MEDWQLLREYVDKGSQAAFSMLVARYVNLVYATCRRELNDAVLAEDVTQVVFLILAKKAPSLREGTILAGWLFKTARFAARDAHRQETRRQRHEQRAAEKLGETRQRDTGGSDLEALLQDGLDQLTGPERNALLLRFFEGSSINEVGARLGISPDAAQKRVARALEKLRRYMARQGYSVATVVVAAWLADHIVHAAPATCVAAVAKLAANVPAGSGAAPAAIGGAAASTTTTSAAASITRVGGTAAEVLSGNVLSLSRTVLQSMLLSQIKAAGMACLGLMLCGTGAGALLHVAFAAPPTVRAGARSRGPAIARSVDAGADAGAVGAELKHRVRTVAAGTFKSGTVRTGAASPQTFENPAKRPVGPSHASRSSSPRLPRRDAAPLHMAIGRLAQAAAPLRPVASAPTAGDGPRPATTAAPGEAAPGEAAPAKPANIFPAGDFEKLDAKGKPVGWRLADAAHMQLQHENGNHFLRLHNDKTPAFTNTNVAVKLDPLWKGLRLKARLRAKGLKVGTEYYEDARLVTLFLGRTGQKTGPWAPGLEIKADADWSEYEVELTIPQGAVHLQLSLQMINAVGTVDYDDIQLIPTTPLPDLVLTRGEPVHETFEHPDTQRQPLRWNLSDKRRMQLLDEDGNHFLRLRNDKVPALVSTTLRVRIAPDCQRPKLEARLRAQNLRVGAADTENARLATMFMDEAGDRVEPWPPGLEIKQDSDWTYREVEIPVPAKAVFFRLSAEMINTVGEVDYDDIKLSAAHDPLPIQPALPEGTFEKQDADGDPAGWSLHGILDCRVVEEEGNHFLRLTNPLPQLTDYPPADVVTALPTIRYSLDPAWKKLTNGVRMRARGLQVAANDGGGAELVYRFENSGGWNLGPVRPALQATLSLRQDSDWVSKSIEVKIPNGATSIALMPAMVHSGGSADFDSIVLHGE